MIWADKVAITLFALIAFGFAMAFVSSDAQVRQVALRAREAKLAAACAELAAPPPGVSAQAPEQDGSAPESAAPQPNAAEAAGPQEDTAHSDALPATPAEPAPEGIVTENPIGGGRPPLVASPLPAHICADERLRAEREAEEQALTVPTVRGTLIELGETELFVVVPVWVGLRIFDVRTGGPRRRLARSAYWRATQGARTTRRRRRRERQARPEAGEE